MKIGIFDSGVGGQSFVDAVKVRFPEAVIIYKDDRENVPYGNKSPEQLFELTLSIFREFENEKCDVVLVACNTITTNIISDLREQLNVPLVGVEPMIKPASDMTKTNRIAVCATPATLGSTRYLWLKNQHAIDVVVFEPDCSNWAYMIEHSMQNELQLKEMVENLKEKNVDVIVLGCTHYHWIEDELRVFANPDIQVIQPIEPVLNQLERVLKGNLQPE
jgi:glutamate racemase